jgi:hypothetical protein
MKTEIGIAVISILVFVAFILSEPPSRYDPRLGKASIWQDPSERKGTWQKTFVAGWNSARNGYITAVFDGRADYVSRDDIVYTGDEVFARLEGYRAVGHAFEYRYTNEEVIEYAESYGLQDLV